jgi:hypothetical protein
MESPFQISGSHDTGHGSIDLLRNTMIDARHFLSESSKMFLYNVLGNRTQRKAVRYKMKPSLQLLLFSSSAFPTLLQSVLLLVAASNTHKCQSPEFSKTDISNITSMSHNPPYRTIMSFFHCIQVTKP